MDSKINLVVSNDQFFDRETGELYKPEDIGFALRRVLYELNTVITFGKHKNTTVQQVIEKDPTYIYWMYSKEFNLAGEVLKASNSNTYKRMQAQGLVPTSVDVNTRRINFKRKQVNVTQYPKTMFDNKGNMVDGSKVMLEEFKNDMDARFFDKYGMDPNEED